MYSVLSNGEIHYVDNITYIKTGSFKEELKSTVKPYVGSTNQEFRRVK